MPIVFADNSKHKLVDGMAVMRWLAEQNPKKIVVEMVGARPAKRFKGNDGEMVAGQGIASTFQFGMSYGAVVALSLACPCPVELVTSSKWKTWMNLLGEKERTRQWALKRHSDNAHFFKRKLDGGRADATAIAEYGRKFAQH